jgi:hypothetical protein
VINTTTQTSTYTNLGKSKATGQPAFLALLSASTASDKTGNGTTYTLICDTEVLDRDSNYNNGTGVFTAPVTGVYAFSARLAWNSVTTQNNSNLTITTSNRNYGTIYGNVVINALRQNASEICDMDAGDTCSLVAIGTGQGADTVGFIGSATNTVTYFAGYLEC